MRFPNITTVIILFLINVYIICIGPTEVRLLFAIFRFIFYFYL